MKFKLKTTIDVELKLLKVVAGVRYWEDADVNGVEDTDGDLIPCRVGDSWCPLIDIETGIITNWEQGKTASIHYKVCDAGVYTLLDDCMKEVAETDGYVIDILAIGDNGYGDYIILEVDENGKIEDWNFNVSDFKKLK